MAEKADDVEFENDDEMLSPEDELSISPDDSDEEVDTSGAELIDVFDDDMEVSDDVTSDDEDGLISHLIEIISAYM